MVNENQRHKLVAFSIKSQYKPKVLKPKNFFQDIQILSIKAWNDRVYLLIKDILSAPV